MRLKRHCRWLSWLRDDLTILRKPPECVLGSPLLVIKLLRVGVGVLVKLAKPPSRFGTSGSKGINHLAFLDPFDGPIHVLRGNAFELVHRERSELHMPPVVLPNRQKGILFLLFVYRLDQNQPEATSMMSSPRFPSG